MSSESKIDIFLEDKNTLIQFSQDGDTYNFTTTLANSDVVPTNTTRLTQKELPPYLTTNKVFIVDSIKSGTGRDVDNKNLYSTIIQPLFKLLQIEYEYFATTSANSIIEFAQSLKSDDVTIIFISGDTSINEFINGLSESRANRNITIFPIPNGTGNGLALSVNLTSPIDSISKLITSTNKPQPFLYLVSFNTQEDPEGNGEYIMKVMKDVYNKGSHASDPDVTYEKVGPGDEITLKTNNTKPIRNRRFCVDGSIIALPEEEQCEIKVNISNNVHKNWNLYIIH
ncbi:hypothetical protein JA1_005429 [Spathaspora sp. JA1]|nr:hypothetical protein JA1_005429 [Spathaspora sp. JA1]